MSDKKSKQASKSLSDEEVARKVRQEDQELYSVLVERYQAKLLRYALSLAKDEQKAKDIVQNAFIKAFVNLNGFDLKMRFSTWIYRIVHNEALNALLKNKQEVPMLEEMDFESAEDISAELITKETQAAVRQCLLKMPLTYSEPLALFFLEEKSYEEISDILRIPLGTVGTRISRAKSLMKKICQAKQTEALLKM